MTEEYIGGARQRILDPIDVNELREKKSCTFELRNEFLEEDDKDLKDEEMQARKSYFQNVSLKNIPVAACSAEDALEDYDEIQSIWKHIGEGIQKKVVQPGIGGVIPPTAKVWIHYMQYHEFSDEPFDSTITSRKPKCFRLGQGEVIPGLDLAVASMELKEVSKFLIQPELAYGPLGCPPRIDGNARILFSIELLEIQEKSEKVEIYEMTAEERAELDFEQIFIAAEGLKNEAKQDVIAGDHQEAVSKYSKAAKMLDEYLLVSPAEEEKRNLMLHTLFNNLALCYIKLEKPKKAREASKSAIQLPVNVKKHKAYYLLGKAYNELGNLGEARKMVEESLTIESNAETRNLLEKIIDMQQAEQNEEKKLCKLMMKRCSLST